MLASGQICQKGMELGAFGNHVVKRTTDIACARTSSNGGTNAGKQLRIGDKISLANAKDLSPSDLADKCSALSGGWMAGLRSSKIFWCRSCSERGHAI